MIFTCVILLFALQVFNFEQEKALVWYIIKCSKCDHSLTMDSIRTLAFDYAKKCEVVYPSGWDLEAKATKDWYYSFIGRHPNLKKRVAKNTDRSSSSEDRERCVKCFESMPKQMNRSNSIECNKCKSMCHLKCSGMDSGSLFTCKSCESDLDISDDE